MGAAMSFEKVGFRYEDRMWALKDISFQAEQGELIGILGPNGSGKTTLLKLGNGLIRPKQGDVFLKEKSVRSYSRLHIAREVAMVPQETHFHFTFSVLEVVLMGRFPYLKRFQFEGERDIKIAQGALEATHSIEFANRSIHELSGGERQRVLIARALAQEPSVMLLDEPTTFLDLKFKKEIFELISWLVRSKGITAIVVSHDIELASKYCDRIIMLKEGQMVFMGSPHEVITSESIKHVYDCAAVVDQNPVTGAPRVSVI
ncbi:MAG: ABC transporter [Deltaproteobacteria bacterium]|nr:MAG: ABC transporter [Deltaproteobacteria bacterium]